MWLCVVTPLININSIHNLSCISFFFCIFASIMKKILITAIIALICGTISAQNTLSKPIRQFCFRNRQRRIRPQWQSDRHNSCQRRQHDSDRTDLVENDARFGNRTEVPVDTLQHGFQNTNDTGGPYGHYTYLGNLGAPRIAHVYFDRKDAANFSFRPIRLHCPAATRRNLYQYQIPLSST